MSISFYVKLSMQKLIRKIASNLNMIFSEDVMELPALKMKNASQKFVSAIIRISALVLVVLVRFALQLK